MAKNAVRSKNRRILIPLAVIVILVAGGFGYTYWNRNLNTAKQQAATQSSLKTAQVRRGNITLSASGSGTLVASQTQNLSFSTSGTVASLKVQVGDKVAQGQVLAQLADLATLQTTVEAAQQDLVSAQQALDTLKQNGPANLGNAQLAVATAQKAVDNARAGYVVPGMMRCDQPTTDAYYSTYMRLKKQLDDLGNGGGNQTYYLNVIVPAQMNVNKAYQTYLNCAGFTNYETDASHAQLDLSQAQLKTAQDNLALLQKNNGTNPTDLATAENKVSTAQVALDQAKQTLDGATLKAPFDGTITAVSGQAGDQVGTSTFITVADLAHPQIQFSIDETDLDKAVKGGEAQIVFDAMPDQPFTGKIIRINPTLVTSGGYNTVQGLIQLDLSKLKNPPTFPSGLSASITLIKGQAQNVLLVPIQAVRDLGNGQYGVFVVNGQGKLQLKIVQVGLMDLTNAEIKSGLSVGDEVSTGVSQTK